MKLIVLFAGLLGNNVISLIQGCTSAESAALGCDLILDTGTFGGGHPDYLGLSGSSSSQPYAGQTLCIPAGNYSALSLAYIEGTATAPIKLINCGGRVIFDGRNAGLAGTGHWTTINGKGCSHIHLSGAGDPSIMYGIVSHDSSSHGVHFDEGSTFITIDHVETYSNNYGGIVVRTYPRCGGRCGHVSGTESYGKLCSRGNFVQSDTVLFDNYVHDTPGEG